MLQWREAGLWDDEGMWQGTNLFYFSYLGSKKYCLKPMDSPILRCYLFLMENSVKIKINYNKDWRKGKRKKDGYIQEERTVVHMR